MNALNYAEALEVVLEQYSGRRISRKELRERLALLRHQRLEAKRKERAQRPQ